MPRVPVWLTIALLSLTLSAAYACPTLAGPDTALSGPSFPVGNLRFTIPAKWQIEPVESPARGGQWRVPPLKLEAEGGQVVAYFFGPNVGGSPRENVQAWIGTMINAEGNPAAAEVKHHVAAGLKITQVVIFGTYNQAVSLPGLPPVAKSNYGLLGAVIEHPQGNIYWRFTGPEPLVTANLSLFNQVLDSVKP